MKNKTLIITKADNIRGICEQCFFDSHCSKYDLPKKPCDAIPNDNIGMVYKLKEGYKID